MTIRLPVHAAAGPPPPTTPDGAFAILRHLPVVGLYAAPSDRGAACPPTLRATPPRTIISRPVHTDGPGSALLEAAARMVGHSPPGHRERPHHRYQKRDREHHKRSRHRPLPRPNHRRHQTPCTNPSRRHSAALRAPGHRHRPGGSIGKSPPHGLDLGRPRTRHALLLTQSRRGRDPGRSGRVRSAACARARTDPSAVVKLDGGLRLPVPDGKTHSAS